MANYQTATNNYQLSRYIVDQDGSTPFKTVQAAIDAQTALSDNQAIIVRGSFTEDLTFYDGTHLISFGGEGAAEFNSIIGVHTPPGGYAKISVTGLWLKSSTSIFSNAAATSGGIFVYNCMLEADNGFTFDIPNWKSSKLGLYNCDYIDGSNDGILNTDSATLEIVNCRLPHASNILVTTTTLRVVNSTVQCPMTFTNSSDIRAYNSYFNRSHTFSGTSSGKYFNSTVDTSSYVEASIATTSTNSIEFHNTVIDTPVAPAITGTGEVYLNNVTFPTESLLAPTLTVTRISTVKAGMFEGKRTQSTDPQFVDEMWNGLSAEWAIDESGGSFSILSITPNGGVSIASGATINSPQSYDWNDICPFISTQRPMFEVRLNIDSTTSTEVKFGLKESGTGSGNDYILISYDASVAATMGLTVATAGATTSDAGAAADTDWHIYRVEWTSDTALEWFIDDVSQGTVTSNVPTTFLQPWISVDTEANAVKDISVDYFKIWQDRT